MSYKAVISLCAITLLVGAASLAMAGVPDLSLSSASTAYTGPGSAVIYNLPNGGGDPFTAARADSGTVDATVTLTLLDGMGYPISNFPFEDMWLESLDGGMVSCIGGTVADYSTDYNGRTVWVSPMPAGGWSQALTSVMVTGAPLASGNLAISYNSADINGDGVVDLTDVPLFVDDFFGSYAFRSDLAYDHSINLGDVVRMAQAIGATCP